MLFQNFASKQSAVRPLKVRPHLKHAQLGADIFAEQNYWDLNIEFRSTDSHEWDSYISGNYEYIHQNSITDDTGMMWYNTDIHDNSPEETVVYVRVIDIQTMKIIHLVLMEKTITFVYRYHPL